MVSFSADISGLAWTPSSPGHVKSTRREAEHKKSPGVQAQNQHTVPPASFCSFKKITRPSPKFCKVPREEQEHRRGQYCALGQCLCWWKMYPLWYSFQKVDPLDFASGLVVRVHLPTQGTRVWALAWEDSHMLWGSWAPCTATAEPTRPSSLQLDKSPSVTPRPSLK